MLRISFGKDALTTTFSRDGKLLPVTAAAIFLEVGKPRKVDLVMKEFINSGIREFTETVDEEREEIQILTQA